MCLQTENDRDEDNIFFGGEVQIQCNISTRSKLVLINFLAMPHSMSDLSSLTRDQTHDPLQQKQSLHPWTSREVPGQLLGPTFFQSSGWTRLTAYQAPAKREGLGCVVKGRAGTVLNKAFELRLAGGKDLDTLPGGSDSRKFCRLSHTHTHTQSHTLKSHTHIHTPFQRQQILRPPQSSYCVRISPAFLLLRTS